MSADMDCGPGGAFQDGGHPEYQFLGAEGFDDVIVGTDFKAGDAVGFGFPGGHEDDGNGLFAEELFGEYETVAVGKHDVQENQVRFAFFQPLFGACEVAKTRNLMIGELQITAYRFTDRLIVFHHVDMCHGDSLAPSEGDCQSGGGNLWIL